MVLVKNKTESGKSALVFCIDILPVNPRIQTSGGSLRSEQLRRIFEEADFKVSCAMPRNSLLVRTQYNFLNHADRSLLFDVGNEAELVASNRPDVVVWAWPLIAQIPVAPMQSTISIVDMNGFQNIESAAASNTHLAINTRALLQRARNADIVLYGSYEQKAYWEGQFQLSGMVVPCLSFVIPFYIDLMEEREYSAPKDFFYVGSVLPWLAPFEALSSAASVISRNVKARLRIFTSTQPGNSDNEDLARFAKEFSNRENIIFEQPRSAVSLYNEIGYSGIAFDVLSPSFEREFAVPIRTVSFLSHGIPIIHNDYTRLGKKIASTGAGWKTGGDQGAVANLIESILKLDQKQLSEFSLRARVFARQEFKEAAQLSDLLSCVDERIGRIQKGKYPLRVIPRPSKIPCVLVISDESENICRLRMLAPLQALFESNLIRGYAVVGNDGLRYSSDPVPSQELFTTVIVQRVPLVNPAFILSLTQGNFIYDIDDNPFSPPPPIGLPFLLIFDRR